jgi:hypothetical protein
MKAEEIFLAALEKSSPTERAAYLDQVCGDDAGLRYWTRTTVAKLTGTADPCRLARQVKPFGG